MSKFGLNREFKELVGSVLESEGVTIYDFSKRGSHFAVAYMLPSGRTRFYVFAGTPSDKRAYNNTKCGVRRVVRKDLAEDKAVSLRVLQDMMEA